MAKTLLLSSLYLVSLILFAAPARSQFAGTDCEGKFDGYGTYHRICRTSADMFRNATLTYYRTYRNGTTTTMRCEDKEETMFNYAETVCVYFTNGRYVNTVRYR